MKRTTVWLALSLVMAVPAAAQVPGLDIDVRAGGSSSGLTETPGDLEYTDSNREVGWFVGGDLKFGSFFFVQPGLYYQHQAFGLSTSTQSDGVGVSSIMIPLQVGVDVDLKVVSLELGVGPTLAFNTSIGDNAFGLVKDDFNNTRVGGLVSAKFAVLFIGAWVGYQYDFTDALKGGGGNMNQWMLGLGFNF